MTSATEKRVDDLLNQLGETAQNFVGNQKQLFNEASVKATSEKVTSLMREITAAAKELTADKIGETPAAAYIYARGVADAMQEQANRTALFSGRRLRKQAGAAQRDIFKGINKMTDTLAATAAQQAKTSNYVRFQPGANKMTIA